ncbi:MAG: hypothetical protein A2Z14_12700 [Chloroflexi bacterium RBG_16_48_8]|nr:MAG: hypothetical protein A2Z14_12700 [Chloroflexi bacterium RBG_16_48_8]
MTRANGILGVALLFIILTATSCSRQDAEEPTHQVEATAEWEAQAQETLTALATPPTAIEEVTPSTNTPLPSPTITITPTFTPTPTQMAPVINVTANTHCRTGPGPTYVSLGVLLVGEDAEVLAQSTVEDFWYILLPDKPDRPCWLSGAYATVEGDTSLLPAFTPIPSPTPEVGFDLFLNSFQSCGSIYYVVFSVQNTGANILETGNIEIVEFKSKATLYGPAFQRFPFAQVVTPVCPPDHGNELFPGQIQYIHVPIHPVPHGKTARGTVKLCTGDYQGGECVTKTIYFDIP